MNITSVFDFKLWPLFLKFIVLYLSWSGVLSYLRRDFMNWKSSFLPSHKEWLVHIILLSGRTLVAQNSLGIGVFFWPLKKLILASFCLMFLSCPCFSLDIYGLEKCCDSLLYVTMDTMLGVYSSVKVASYNLYETIFCFQFLYLRFSIVNCCRNFKRRVSWYFELTP